MKQTRFKVLLATGLCMLAVAGALIYRLVSPGTPASSSSLHFIGYVPLPKSGFLNILDYLTIDHDRLFVAGESSGNVSQIVLGQPGVPMSADVKTLAGMPETHGIVIDPTSRLAFVTRSSANTVDVFDPSTMQLLDTIPVADDPDGIFYDPDDKLVYVAGGDSSTGTLIDPATRLIVGAIALGGKPEFGAYDVQTKLFYQNLQSTNEVVALDLSKRSIVGRWHLEDCVGPSGMALEASKRKLYIACSGNAKAAVFDLTTHNILMTLPVGTGPDTLALDHDLHRVYTAGRAGITSVLDEDANGLLSLVEDIHTHYGAHTLGVDPKTHKVYIAYASLLLAPRIAVFESTKLVSGPAYDEGL